MWPGSKTPAAYHSLTPEGEAKKPSGVFDPSHAPSSNRTPNT